MADAALIDALTDAFAEELGTVLEIATERMRQLIRTLDTDETGRIAATQQNLARVVRLRADLARLLEAAGYRDLVESATDEPLDQIAAQILRSTKAPLTTFDLDALIAMKQIRFAELLQIGEEAAIGLWRVVLDGVTGVRPVLDLVDDIADLLDISEKHARVLYDTAVSTYSRQVGLIGTTGKPDELFVYVGPNDSKTRDFCADLIGQVHTRDEIDAMDNGQLPNVMLTGGGFNCRHQFRRVSPLDDELIARRAAQTAEDTE
jgi:hypothetical protein